MPGGGIGAGLGGDVAAGELHLDVGGIGRQVAAQQLEVGAADRHPYPAHAHRLYRRAHVRVGQLADVQGQDGPLRRQRVQRIEGEHLRDGIEEQDLVAQQPAVLGMVDVLGDEADQVFQFLVARDLAVVMLPRQLVADDALPGVEQRFADDEVSLMHVARE